MAVIKGQASRLLITLDVEKMPYKYYLQGAIFSAGYWWLCSSQDNVSGSGGRQSNHISKFDKKGKYLGRMTCLGSGHGSAFAMDGTTVILGWETGGGDRLIRKVAWTKDRKVKESEATLINTGTGTWNVYPLPLDGNYLTLRRRSGGYDEFRLRLYSDPDRELRAMRVKPLHPANKSEGTFQGAFSFGRNVFVLYAATDDNPQQLAQYQWSTSTAMVTWKTPLSVLNVTNMGRESKQAKEPEGLSVYNGRLVMGQRHGNKTRSFRIRLFDNVTREGITLPPPAIPPVVIPPPPVIKPWPPVPPPIKPPVDKCANPPIATRLSGASGAGVPTGEFGNWRGSRLGAIGTWLNDPAIYPFTPSNPGCPECGEYAAWGGAADVGLAPADAIWQGWDAEAAGVNDEWWRELAANLRARWRDRLRDVWYLRPYYEANGDWFTYAILDKVASFKTAFARTSTILQQEFPESSIMLGVSAATPGPGRPLVSDIWPDDGSFSALSIDFYNTFPWVNTAAAFTTKINSGAEENSLEPLRVLAQSHGKPVVISEWGSASVNNGGGGGDAPQFFTSFANWLDTHEGRGAGQVLMEVYFNVAEGYDDQYWLWNKVPNPKQPQAAARYSTLWRETVVAPSAFELEPILVS